VNKFWTDVAETEKYCVSSKYTYTVSYKQYDREQGTRQGNY